MDQPDQSRDADASSWRTPTPREKKIFVGIAGVLGALSAVAQFLGTYIDNGLVLFAVCLALMTLFVGAVMALRRVRRAAVWTMVLLVAVAAGGSVGYAVGRKGSGRSDGAPSPSPRATRVPVDSPTTPSSAGRPQESGSLDANGGGAPHDMAFTLSADSSGSRAVMVNTMRLRTPISGHAFWLVLEIHGVNGHSEFYPSKDLTAVTEKYRYLTELPDGASVKNRRTGRVYEVDGNTAMRMKAIKEEGRVPPLDELLKPPCDDCSVSDEVELPFAE